MRFHNESGVTLLEMAFALGILGMALAFLFGSLIAIAVVGESTQSRAVAVTHLGTVMEELRSLSFNDVMAYVPPVFDNLTPDEAIAVDCFQADGSTLTLPVDPTTLATPLPNPLCVRCTVTWHNPQGRAYSVRGSQMYLR